MTDIGKILDRVRKLRGLATSSNVHEAAAAAAQADRLLQEHGLSEAQLEAEGVKEGERVAEAAEPLVDFGARSPTWLVALSIRIAKHYGCAIYTDAVRNGGEVFYHRRQRLVGRPSDVETVRYMYAWLSTEIERLAQATTRIPPPASVPGAKPIPVARGRRWLNFFRRGAVDGVMGAMEEAKRAAEASAKAAGASAAIVLVQGRGAEALSVLHALHDNLRSASVGGPIDRDAFARGQSAGRRINRDAHLTGASAKALPVSAGG